MKFFEKLIGKLKTQKLDSAMLVVSAMCFVFVSIYILVFRMPREMWQDEMFSSFFANNHWVGSIFWDNSGHFYYLFGKLIKVFADVDYKILRYLSFTFACVSSVVCFLIGRRISSSCAWILFLLSVFDSGRIFYAAEARAYSLLELLAVINLYFFVVYLSQNKIKHYYLLGLTQTLLIFTHPMAFIFVIGQIFVLYVKNIRNKKILILLAAFGFASNLVFQNLRAYPLGFLDKTESFNLVNLIAELYSGQLAGHYFSVLLFVVIVLFNLKNLIPYIVWIIVSTICFLITVYLFQKNMIHEKYNLAFSPLLNLMFAIALSKFWQSHQKILASVALVAMIGFNVHFFTTENPRKVSNLSDFMKEFSTQNTCLVHSLAAGPLKNSFKYYRIYNVEDYLNLVKEDCPRVVYFSFSDYESVYNPDIFQKLVETHSKELGYINLGRYKYSIESVETIVYEIYWNPL